MVIDLNADVGEGCGQDAALMPLLSSANICCGAHAGDEDSMRAALRLAKFHGVAVGAHPGYPDRAHFGRREMPLPPPAVYAEVLRQIRILADIAQAEGVALAHVKPHGALYNQAARDRVLAEAITAAVRDYHPQLRIVGLAGGELTAAARRLGLAAVEEAFADRRYRADGTLLDRSQPGALIEDVEEAVQQALCLAKGAGVLSCDGRRVSIKADSLCLHGDGRHAVDFARRIRLGLEAAGIAIGAFSSVLGA